MVYVISWQQSSHVQSMAQKYLSTMSLKAHDFILRTHNGKTEKDKNIPHKSTNTTSEAKLLHNS
jgi:hypothetical protein